jgi:hypothetical protein
MSLHIHQSTTPQSRKEDIIMFIQVYQVKLRDADLWTRQLETWRREIKPKTTGFIGLTSGVTADNYVIVVVRFESEEAANVDNNLPEQGAWFEQASRAFDGELVAHKCREVDVLLDGGSNDAGFVQIMQGRAKNQQQMRDQTREMGTELRTIRPDLIGATVAWHGDGGLTETAYFTSEQDARQNEQAMARSSFYERFMSMIDGDLIFYDIPSPSFE